MDGQRLNADSDLQGDRKAWGDFSEEFNIVVMTPPSPQPGNEHPVPRIGVIADTHGLLRPQALDALAGSQLILHAGDVGTPEVLDGLRRLAPVIAVRGNVDRGDWAMALPLEEIVVLAGHRLLLLHSLAERSPAAPGDAEFSVIVSGHSHQPREEWIGGTLCFNPGSAGPRRFRLPVAVGRLSLEDNAWHSEIVLLAI
jgi:putative phosphoesterase